jgi:putative SOS response-associated peptidase YedK
MKPCSELFWISWKSWGLLKAANDSLEIPTDPLFLMKWGLTPSFASKQLYLINARSEGIVMKPSFRKPIRSQRCLVIASAFFEGNTVDKLSKPYLIYLQNKKHPFAFAGIWDTWKDETKTEPNDLLKKIGHDRMALILNQHEESTWLNSNEELTNITRLLKSYTFELMNAYLISPDIKNPKNNYKELLNPIGERLQPEYDYKKETKLQEQGWGGKKKKDNGDDDLTLGERRQKKV